MTLHIKDRPHRGIFFDPITLQFCQHGKENFCVCVKCSCRDNMYEEMIHRKYCLISKEHSLALKAQRKKGRVTMNVRTGEITYHDGNPLITTPTEAEEVASRMLQRGSQ